MSNHLIHSTSPYLLQHAENPVDWHPWDAKALEKARREDKPIFLSIFLGINTPAELPILTNFCSIVITCYNTNQPLSNPSRKHSERGSAHGIHFLNRSYQRYRDKCLELGGMNYHHLRTFVYAHYHPFRLSGVAVHQSSGS